MKWPEKKLLSRSRLVVSGETAPGAHVQIGGHVVTASADGKFQHTMTLPDGDSDVQVKAMSVGGVEAASDAHLQVDTHAPKVTVKHDLWNQKP